ncbi:MAG: GNAT family N-acetyltransferase [Treponema sp.]|nr:GNAT family N-acetyltransferase [Treponema sp.]
MEIKKATADDIETLVAIRLEMLRVVNNLPNDAVFDKELVECSREYFLHGDQTTVIAIDGEKTIGCASISYIYIMPTFDHPTGKRAHLMNVYTNSAYRKQGIGKKMVEILIEEAKAKHCTEISLDATEQGRSFYLGLGFTPNEQGMILNLK